MKDIYTNSEDIGRGDFAEIRVRTTPLPCGAFPVQIKDERGIWQMAGAAHHIALRDARQEGEYLVGTQRPNTHSAFLLDPRDTFLN